MASTVLRVKRRLEDNPQDALVLMCKRMKTENKENVEISPSLFVFRGSVDNKENTLVKDLVPKENLLKSKHNVKDIISKIRKERQDFTTQSRYEVVKLSRGLTDDNLDASDDVYDLVDLQLTIKTEEDNVQYKYDIYTAAKPDFDISMLDNLVSIENYETDLVFGSHRDNGQAATSDEDDDDDSNDENNWRNDYPDSEASSIDEEDMIRAVEKLDIVDDLSTDAEEDKIYDQPPDLFNEDVQRYGEAYAKYKARVIAEEGNLSNGRNLIHCSVKDIDEESVEGYKEDSDGEFYYGQELETDQFREQYESDSSAYTPD